jgi:hypothetical protein
MHCRTHAWCLEPLKMSLSWHGPTAPDSPRQKPQRTSCNARHRPPKTAGSRLSSAGIDSSARVARSPPSPWSDRSAAARAATSSGRRLSREGWRRKARHAECQGTWRWKLGGCDHESAPDRNQRVLPGTKTLHAHAARPLVTGGVPGRQEGCAAEGVSSQAA